MPHCILEYSANIPDKVDFPAFFSQLHEALSASGHIDRARLKSRWIRHDSYYVAEGSPRSSFVYLQIALISGRSEEIRKDLGERAFALLKQFFPISSREISCSMTLEMREMLSTTHFKN